MQKTLSIPQELENFLVDNPDLSPSKMLQSKIMEVRENRKVNFAEINKLQRQNKFLSEKLMDSGDRVAELEEKIKLMEDKQ